MRAAKSGKSKELKPLYQESLDNHTTDQVINVADDKGRSALHWSIINNNTEAAEYIIQVGADVNTATNEKDRSEGNTPLISASSDGYVSIVKKLIKNGAKVNAAQKDGTHAAFIAAQEGHLDVLKLLIYTNPNVTDLKGCKGRSPLAAAAQYGLLEIVEYLTSLPDTNINNRDDLGLTPLILATSFDHPNVVRFLVQKEAVTGKKITRKKYCYIYKRKFKFS